MAQVTKWPETVQVPREEVTLTKVVSAGIASVRPTWERFELLLSLLRTAW